MHLRAAVHAGSPWTRGSSRSGCTWWSSARSGPRAAGSEETWPTYIIAVTMATCVFAMALTDIKTCTVPLAGSMATAAGLIIHPLHGLLVGMDRGKLIRAAPGYVWTIPTPSPTNWWWIGLALGVVLGFPVSNALLAAGLIGRSFADYDAWEKEALAQQAADQQASGQPASGPQVPGAPADPSVAPTPGPGDGVQENHPTDLWVQYPHVCSGVCSRS